MNWYKQSQQNNITMDDIIWAIDDILLKEYDFSMNDLLEAEQRINYPQEEIAKAAQVKTRKIKRHTQNPATFQLPSKKVEELTNKGFSDREISQQLGMPVEEVRRINKNLFPKLKDKQQHLHELNDKNVLNTTRKLTDDMRKDLSINNITVQQISDSLGGVSIGYIRKVLKDNNVDLFKLITDRKNVLSEMLVTVVNKMKEPYTSKDIQETFKKRYNHLIPHATLDRMLKFKNLSTTKATTSSALIFTAFKRFLETRGVKDINLIQPEKLSKIIDQFIIEVGPGYGFVKPMDQIKLKTLFMTKVQLRERVTEQKSNRSWLGDFNITQNDKKNIINLIKQEAPLESIISQFAKYDPNIIKQFYHTYQLQSGPVITDENHPSYFLTDDEKIAKTEMNWYKKAEKCKKHIPGGNADNRRSSDFDQKELSRGKKVELEHTKNPDIAKEITMDHLEEHKDYYTGLEHMENMLSDMKKKKK